MIARFLLVSLYFSTATSILAEDHYTLQFDIINGEETFERGIILADKKKYIWSKELKRSNLKLTC